jgi:Brp/Blh family beta-carotene 15,15'-monooxygenase
MLTQAAFFKDSPFNGLEASVMDKGRLLHKTERLMFPIVAVVAMLLVALTPEWLSPMAQLIGLALLVVLLGLPHGALDPWVAESMGLCQTRAQTVIFTLGYLSMAALVVLLWLWFPASSLLFFLIISAWHFSGDWAKTMGRPARWWAGAALLLMPIAFHTTTVAEIFTHLSGPGGATLAHALALPVPWLLAAMAAITGLALWRGQWQVAMEYVLLLGLAYVTPPLVYFAIYFSLLHSPRHLLGLWRQAPLGEQGRLIRMLVVYTAATLLLALPLWWLWVALPTESIVLRLVFIGLAAVTVPHMILITAAQRQAIRR